MLALNTNSALRIWSTVYSSASRCVSAKSPATLLMSQLVMTMISIRFLYLVAPILGRFKELLGQKA